MFIHFLSLRFCDEVQSGAIIFSSWVDLHVLCLVIFVDSLLPLFVAEDLHASVVISMEVFLPFLFFLFFFFYCSIFIVYWYVMSEV